MLMSDVEFAYSPEKRQPNLLLPDSREADMNTEQEEAVPLT